MLFTTHAPQLAKLVPVESVRYVEKIEGSKKITEFDITRDNKFLENIATDLGVLTDDIERLSNIKLIIYVEGKFDVEFLYRVSELFHKDDSSFINLREAENILIIPCGGSSLQEWVDKNYLSKLGNIPELHIYDRDIVGTEKYQKMTALVTSINDRGNIGFLTQKRELENYIPCNLVRDHFGFESSFSYSDDDDVSKLVAHTFYLEECASQGVTPTKKWGGSASNAKKRINEEIVPKITLDELRSNDTSNEIEGWLKIINNLISVEVTH